MIYKDLPQIEEEFSRIPDYQKGNYGSKIEMEDHRVWSHDAKKTFDYASTLVLWISPLMSIITGSMCIEQANSLESLVPKEGSDVAPVTPDDPVALRYSFLTPDEISQISTFLKVIGSMLIIFSILEMLLCGLFFFIQGFTWMTLFLFVLHAVVSLLLWIPLALVLNDNLFARVFEATPLLKMWYASSVVAGLSWVTLFSGFFSWTHRTFIIPKNELGEPLKANVEVLHEENHSFATMLQL